MNLEQTHALRTLIETRQVAALGTLHRGEPYVSMVPYALRRGAPGFVLHVSRLAPHTKDMLEHPSVSLLVMALQAPDMPAQSLPRATVQGLALPLVEGEADHDEARHAYLKRFPQSEPMFGFADFSLFVVVPRSLRFVAGFGQAMSVTAEGLADLLGQGT
jgi:putative heme iron utilization protein